MVHLLMLENQTAKVKGNRMPLHARKRLREWYFHDFPEPGKGPARKVPPASLRTAQRGA